MEPAGGYPSSVVKHVRFPRIADFAFSIARPLFGADFPTKVLFVGNRRCDKLGSVWEVAG